MGCSKSLRENRKFGLTRMEKRRGKNEVSVEMKAK
jgi:hypothetical protein